MDKVYTVQEVSEIMKVHKNTVKVWIATNKIKSIKVGGARRVPASEVDRLIKGE